MYFPMGSMWTMLLRHCHSRTFEIWPSSQPYRHQVRSFCGCIVHRRMIHFQEWTNEKSFYQQRLLVIPMTCMKIIDETLTWALRNSEAIFGWFAMNEWGASPSRPKCNREGSDAYGCVPGNFVVSARTENDWGCGLLLASDSKEVLLLTRLFTDWRCPQY